jgi:DNA-directed RNA polymerase subunit K/omega
MRKEEIQALNFPKINLKELYEKHPNRFLLSVGVSKRARQLKEGAKPLVTIAHNEPFNPISIAMKEILAGTVSVVVNDESEDHDILLDELESNLDEDLKAEDALEEKAEKEAKKKDSKRKSSKSLAA